MLTGTFFLDRAYCATHHTIFILFANSVQKIDCRAVQRMPQWYVHPARIYKKATNILRGIYFEDLYSECLTCWFRLCNSCTPLHRDHFQHFLQPIKAIREARTMPQLNTAGPRICACCGTIAKLGMQCTACAFAICLTCHLAPDEDFESKRMATSRLLINHALEHGKYSSLRPLMISIRGILFFMRSLPPIEKGCRCINDSTLVNHCGTCYTRGPLFFPQHCS